MKGVLAVLVLALVCAAPAAAQEPPVLLAAGDIAGCSSPGDEATAALLDARPGVIAVLGDTAYPDGSAADFASCYEPSWGRHKARTRPAVGNHEYRTPGAAAYFAYFGPAAGDPSTGYYSYDLGSWHVVVLNSNCGFVACYPGSPQETWLRKDLAASGADCTIAYWHHARFSSGRFPQLDVTEPFWKALFEHGADVVLSGHDHIYDRHTPQTPSGDPDPAHGIRQFVVGTGGHSHSNLRWPTATSEVSNNDTFGILEVRLREGAYDWTFLPEAGGTFTDSGSGSCHGAPPDVTSPTVSLDAPASGAVLRGPVELVASATDDRRLARVEFVIDVTPVASDTSAPYTMTWDSTGIPDGVRRLHARAVDGAGNPTNSESRLVVIDNALPETTIVRGPEGPVSAETATFTFRSEPGASFECSLDRRPLAPCASPVRYEKLAAGPHRFRVRARDAAGNLEAVTLTRSWTVDVKAPATRIEYTELRAGSARFRFAASEEEVTFACSVDEGAWGPCVSPLRLGALKPGRHELRVRATDAAANTDWTAVTRAWSVRVTAGRTWITGGETSEVLVGAPGPDTLRGLGGNDRLVGGEGADTLVGGTGTDVLDGGAGPDWLYARDRSLDDVRGGPGRDRAWLDRGLDRHRGVEKRIY